MGFLPGFLSFDCFANATRENTLKRSIELFANAHHSIRIVAGNLDSSFYKEPRTVNALNSAIGKGVNVELAYYPSSGNKTAVGRLAEHTPKVRFVILKDDPPRHWVVVDGKHVRIERTHVVGEVNTRALICKNAPGLADEFDSKFEELANVK